MYHMYIYIYIYIYNVCMHGRLMVLRVRTNIMGSRGYLVLRHTIMAQGTLECNIVLFYLMIMMIIVNGSNDD